MLRIQQIKFNQITYMKIYIYFINYTCIDVISLLIITLYIYICRDLFGLIDVSFCKVYKKENNR